MAKNKERGAFKGLIRRIFRFLLKTILFLIIFSIAQTAFLRYVNPPFTFSMAYLWLKDRLSSEHYVVPKGEWCDLRDISPYVIQAVLAGEDQRFMSHRGFDFVEIDNAVKDFAVHGKVRGASTITMQLARTLFLWDGRSVSRKILEAYYTVLIETFLSKMRILELYLNMVDWGNGIIGVEAASLRYFGVSASELDASQAALLAAVLPNPHKWSPVNPDRQVLSRQKRIMKSMDKMSL